MTQREIDVPQWAVPVVEMTRERHCIRAEYSDKQVYAAIMDIEAIDFRTEKERSQAYCDEFNEWSDKKKMAG
jgi:hypothetical protein